VTSVDRARVFLASRPHIKAELEAKYEAESIVLVIAAAYDETVRLERARCVAHLTLARACGHLDVGYQAVSDGVSVDSMRAKYMDLAIRKGGFQGATVQHLLSSEGSS
jgi:hypothetical protein